MTQRLPYEIPVETGHGSAPDYRTSRSGWAGWAIFAGVMMIMLGAFTAFAGLVAIFDHTWYRPNDTALFTLNYTAWGWFWLIVGFVVLLSGFGVLVGNAFARFVGVVLALLSAFGQLVFITAYPLWSIIIITVDVVVIYALTAHGRELRA